MDGGIYIQLLVLVLALLICDAAAGLASGLARGLALAASTVLFAEGASLDSFDMLHLKFLQEFVYDKIIPLFYI